MTLTAEQIFNPTFETATPEFVFPTETFTPEQPVFSGGDCIHIVRIGDNLFRLSMYYGVPIKDIAADNGITNYDLIIVNQELRIRGCGTTGNRPPNEGSFSGGGDVTTSGGSDFTPTGGVVHIVEQGETLYQISLRYGVPIREIQSRNNIANVNLIYFNQELIIP
jgi:LysM repeat protein